MELEKWVRVIIVSVQSEENQVTRTDDFIDHLNMVLIVLPYFKGQRYIASVCHIISLIEFRKPFTQSKCFNCIGRQNNNILKKLFHAFIQTVILKLVMLNYG